LSFVNSELCELAGRQLVELRRLAALAALLLDGQRPAPFERR